MEKRVEEIEKRIFFIEMADHLESEDYRLLQELRKELKSLKGE